MIINVGKLEYMAHFKRATGQISAVTDHNNQEVIRVYDNHIIYSRGCGKQYRFESQMYPCIDLIMALVNEVETNFLRFISECSFEVSEV